MTRKLAAILILPVIIAIHLATAYLVLDMTGYLERTVVRLFETYVNGKLDLDRADIDLLSGIRLENVTLFSDISREPVLSTRAIRISLSGRELLQGRFSPTLITLEEPVFTIEQHKNGTFPLQSLIREDKLDALEKTGSQEGDLRVFFDQALIRLTGTGPLPAEIRGYVQPGRALQIRIPRFQWIGASHAGGSDRFTALITHAAMGDIRIDGVVDAKGIQSLNSQLLATNPRSREFRQYFSDGVSEFVEILGLKGEPDIHLASRRGPDGEYTNRFRFAGISLFAEDFPLLFTDVEGAGRIDIEKQVITIDTVTADTVGTSVAAEGRFHLQPAWNCRFTFSGQDVPFCEEIEHLVEALDSGPDYRAFAPEGKGDFVYHGRASKADPEVRGDLFIRPRGEASASYEGYYDPITGIEDAFPWRVYGLRGEIQILDDRVCLRSIEGYTRLAPDSADPKVRTGRGRVFIDGCVGIYDSDFPTDLEILCQDMTVTEELMEAVRRTDPETAAYLRSLDLSGRFDADVHLLTRADGKEGQDIELNLRDVRLCPEEFPCPLTHVSGRVKVIDEGQRVLLEGLRGYTGMKHPDLIPSGAHVREAQRSSSDPFEVDFVSGEHGGSEIFIDGEIVDNIIERICIRGVHLRVAEVMKKALRVILPESYAYLLDIDYNGFVNFKYIEDRKGEGDTESRLDLALFLNRVSGGKLPTPMEDLRGLLTVDLDSGSVNADSLALRAGDGRFVFSRLNVDVAEDQSILLDIQGEGQHLALNADLSGLLERDANQMVRVVGMGGGVDLNRIDLMAQFDPFGKCESLTADLGLRFNGGSLDKPIEINHIHGDLDLEIEKRARGDSGFLLRGHTTNLVFEVKKRLFTNVESNFRIDEEKLEFSRFQSAFYGGKVAGKGDIPLSLRFNAPRNIQGSFDIVETDLKHFFDRQDYTFKNVDGKLSANLDFFGDLDNLHKIEAAGKVEVVEGSLIEIPFFAALSRVIGSVFAMDPPTFSGGMAQFTFDGYNFALNNVALEGTYVQLTGGGVASFEGLDMRFKPATSFMPRIPIVGDIVNLIKDGLLTFNITGPWNNMNVDWDFLLVNKIFNGDRVQDQFRYKSRVEYTFDEYF